MAGSSTWQEVSSKSLYIQNAISRSLNLARGAIWILELGKRCYPNTKGSKLAMDADMTRSYIWVPHISGLYFYLFLFLS
jgi:hypothetical protein